MSDAIRLLLGDIEFRGFELPEDGLPFGGEQLLKTFRLQGGKKVFHPMGADEAPIDWSGRFRGPEAIARARAVDALRRAGKPVRLSVGEIAYTVVVSRFQWRRLTQFEVPYSIAMEVVTDDAQPTTPGQTVGPTQMMTSDLASSLAAAAGAPALSGALGGLQSAVAAVRDFGAATRDQLAQVMRPVLAARAAVGEVFQAAEDTLGAVSAVGGVVPGLYARDLTGGLLAQVSAARDGVAAFEADAFLGRMATNLGAVGSNGSVVTVAGGNLFAIAQRVYGAADEWATIARANNLTDPDVIGAHDLVIPPNSASTGGVLDV